MNKPRGRKKAPSKIVWSGRARTDLAQIGAYIAADNPQAAERWVEKLIAVVEQAAEFPMAGRVVPEFTRDDLRERFLRHYRVVYRLRKNCIEVVTLFEGHRQFPLDAVPGDD